MSDNLKVAKECGFHVYANTLGNTNNVDGTEHSLNTYTSRILASQQAAHEAGIARLKEEIVQQKERNSIMKSNMEILEAELRKEIAYAERCALAQTEHAKIALEKLSSANAACAMNVEVMKAAEADLPLMPNLSKAKLLAAISVSTQQVAEWERKQLEPLRAQVAMLRSEFSNCAEQLGWHEFPNTLRRAAVALGDTQATAEQFIAECEQRGAADMCDWLADNPPRTLGMWSHMELHDKAYELRATSKKAG